MQVKSAEFVKSAVKPDQYPPAGPPEIAFAGRSNVGKSSLINTLLGRRRLVKTSSTPGRTQLLNFFSINGEVFFVDLPGYGYAKVPERIRKQWGPMVETYLAGRSSLKGVVLIMDIRRRPGEEESDFINWLIEKSIPPVLVLTKADKLGRGKQVQQVRAVAKDLSLPEEALVVFSAKTRLGAADVWRAVDHLLFGDATAGRQKSAQAEDHEKTRFS
jgi:GTP-binding protein